MSRAFIFTALLALACPAGAATAVKFTSADGCALAALYQAPSTGAYVFVNAHGLGSNKEEWAVFQQALEARGQGYLSIDLRGHGGSRTCSGIEADYKTFTKADWGKVYRDIEAGAAWLKKKKVPSKRLVFCGASVGANLVLKAAALGKLKPAEVVLLSPGVEYAGVSTEGYLAVKQPFTVIIAASPDDPYAWQSSSRLAGIARAKGPTVIQLQGESGHGVNMFKTPGLMTAIIDLVLEAPGAKPK